MIVIPMMVFGLFHFLNASAMTDMVPAVFPYPIAWVYLTGAALILAGVGIIIGKKAKLAAQLLGLMLVLFAILIHLPNMSSPSGMSNLLKDLAIAGGIWYMSSNLKS